MANTDIPDAWIKSYIDQLMSVAKDLDEHSPMRAELMLRADHAMDLVASYRESLKRKPDPR